VFSKRASVDSALYLRLQSTLVIVNVRDEDEVTIRAQVCSLQDIATKDPLRRTANRHGNEAKA
jgi:hypothetical protein